MQSRLRVVLVEDDPSECSGIVRYAETLADAEIVAVTNSSDKALQYVKEYLPDAVILDLELHKGSGNGLLFLAELRTLNPQKIPYVLVTTNNISGITHAQARTMGADFIMSKHQDDYTEKSALDFLCAMKSAIKASFAARRTVVAERPEDDERKKAQQINRLMNEFNLIGISPKLIGRKYLMEAVLLISERPQKNICAKIAEKYDVTEASVERAMQNAINRAWKTTSIEDLSFYYTARVDSDRGVPQLMEFVHYYAEKLNFG